MMTTEQALDHIWNVLHSYGKNSLGNKYADEWSDEWSEICLAMATITEQMEEEPMINQYVEE